MNPFLTVGYYTLNHFCDREQEHTQILDALENHRNLTVYSLRRMGKSSLIKHVLYHLEKKKNVWAGLYYDIMATRNDQYFRFIQKHFRQNGPDK